MISISQWILGDFNVIYMYDTSFLFICKWHYKILHCFILELSLTVHLTGLVLTTLMLPLSRSLTAIFALVLITFMSPLSRFLGNNQSAIIQSLNQQVNHFIKRLAKQYIIHQITINHLNIIIIIIAIFLIIVTFSMSAIRIFGTSSNTIFHQNVTSDNPLCSKLAQ